MIGEKLNGLNMNFREQKQARVILGCLSALSPWHSFLTSPPTNTSWNEELLNLTDTGTEAVPILLDKWHESSAAPVSLPAWEAGGQSHAAAALNHGAERDPLLRPRTLLKNSFCCSHKANLCLFG